MSKRRGASFSRIGLRHRVRNEALQLLFGGWPVFLAVQCSLALLLGWVLWGQGQATLVSAWLGLFLLFNGLCFGLCWLFRRRQQSHHQRSRGESRFWFRIFLGATFLAASAWGLASVMTFPHGDALGQAVLALALAGLAIAPLFLLSASILATGAWLIPIVLPFIIYLSLYGATESQSILVVFVGLILLALLAVRGLSGVLGQSLQFKAKAAERESYYATLFHQSPLGLFHYSGKGVLLDMNARFIRIIGSSRERLSGLDLLQDLKDETFKQAIRDSLEKGHATYEGTYQSVTADKATPVRVRLNAIRDADGDIIGGVGIVEDFSDRYATEKALEDSESMLRRTAAVAGVGGWEVLLPSMTVRWTPKLYALHDVSADFEPTVETALDFYPEGEDRECIRRAVSRCRDTGAAFDEEVRLMTAKGRLLWVRVMGEKTVDGDQGERLVGVVQDVTSRREAELALEERRRMMQYVANNVPGMIYQLRWSPENDRLTMPYVSEKIRDIFAVGPDKVRTDAQILFEYLHPDDIPRVHDTMEKSRRDLTPYRQQFRVRLPGSSKGEVREEWVEAVSQPESQGDGGVIWHGFASRITERKQLESQLWQQTNFDSLTGLPNRVLIKDRIGQALHRARRNQGQLAVMHLDLDGFKDINEAWGHDLGDHLLQQVAVRLSGLVNGSESLGRLGGDEFLVAMETNGQGDEAVALTEQIAKALDEPFHLGDQAFRLSTSIGISLYPTDGTSTEDLLRHADSALHRAKLDGVGQWTWYKPALTEAALARRYLESELRAALEREQIQAALQPVVRLSDGQVMGYEALARWQHVSEGWIPPGRFIPVAESRGLVSRLGEAVYRQAFARLLTLPEADGAYLALNVAPCQLQEAGFAKGFLRLLRTFAVDPARLELEITEQAFMGGLSEPLRQLHYLRDAGVRVSIDDFGTGFSSLSYLRQLPIDRLKIDMSFVRDVHRRPENAAIVNTIVALANEFALQVTAEGIESAEEAAHLRASGCGHGQGFYFGHPQLAEADSLSADSIHSLPPNSQA